MNNQVVTVNLIPGLSTPAVVRVSQYDVGRPITFNILDGASAASISPSMTVTVVGTKPSGLGFSQSAVIASLSTVTINTTLAMTQECGMIPAEIRFTQSGENIGTANFILAVEPSPHPDGTTDGTQETMADLETRLQDEIDALDTRVDALEAGSGGSGLTDDIKTALLNCFAHVAWVDADGQDYYDALESALDSGDLSVSLTLSQVSSSNTATTVGYGESYTTTLTASTGYTLNTVSVTMGGVDITSTAYSSGTITIPSVTGNIVITATAVSAAQSITATYTQSGTVYDTDTLDSLKADLVVTANYSGGTSETVPASNYTLSGTLTVGTSTITVTYAGLTTTFNVTVSYGLDSIAYGTLTYRDMFITNNLIRLADFESQMTLNSTWQDDNYGAHYKINAGSPSISTEASESPTHSLKCFATTSTQIIYNHQTVTLPIGDCVVCCSVKVDRYVQGTAGIQAMTPQTNAVDKITIGATAVTDGFVQFVDFLAVTAERTGLGTYIGTISSANCDAYIDDAVVFIKPNGLTKADATTLYSNYLAIRRNQT